MTTYSPLLGTYASILLIYSLASAGPPACQGADLPRSASFPGRDRAGEFHVRVMTWNVWVDSILAPDGSRAESFARIVKAVDPDVLCLQELIRAGATSELPSTMDQLLPLEGGRHWQMHHATNTGSVVLSRYPLVRRSQEPVNPLPMPRLGRPDFHMGHLMCLVDLPERPNIPDLYVITTHFISRTDEARIRARQRQADAMVRWVGTLKQAGHENALSPGTPIVILGDLNVYESDPRDAAHHLTTLLTGNIIDEAAFGPDIKPDWDDTFLLEVKPRHNGREKDWYTWRVDSDRFPPGALDRILYTDSVMQVRNSFVLNTTTMKEDELRRSGLLTTDVLRDGKPGDFDHLPLVADFVFTGKY